MSESLKQASQTPEMDKLVDEILRGERVLFFPPGLWAFLLVNMLTLAGGVFAVALVAKSVAGADKHGQAIAHVVSVLTGSAFAIVVGGVVAVGVRSSVTIVRRVLAVMIAFAVIALVLLLGGALAGPRVPHLVATGMLGLAYAVTGSEPYFTLALFRQRLRVRRAAMFAPARGRG